jgi:hypothetical protein
MMVKGSCLREMPMNFNFVLTVNLEAWGDNLVTNTTNRFNSPECKWKELHEKRVVRI